MVTRPPLTGAACRRAVATAVNQQPTRNPPSATVARAPSPTPALAKPAASSGNHAGYTPSGEEPRAGSHSPPSSDEGSDWSLNTEGSSRPWLVDLQPVGDMPLPVDQPCAALQEESWESETDVVAPSRRPMLRPTPVSPVPLATSQPPTRSEDFVAAAALDPPPSMEYRAATPPQVLSPSPPQPVPSEEDSWGSIVLAMTTAYPRAPVGEIARLLHAARPSVPFDEIRRMVSVACGMERLIATSFRQSVADILVGEPSGQAAVTHILWRLESMLARPQ